MSRTKIFSIYIVVDLAIMAGMVWSFFHRWPPRQYFVAAIILFVLNGLWLIAMTIRHTPQAGSGPQS